MGVEILLLGLLVVAALIIAGAVRSNRKKNSSRISFRESMDLTDLPVITFQCADRKLNFLLDTGSTLSYINKSVVEGLPHEKTGTASEMVGIEGNRIVTECCWLTVSYRNQKFHEEFSAADLDKAFNAVKQETGVQIHGILGSRFFEKYQYVLDFKELAAYIK